MDNIFSFLGGKNGAWQVSAMAAIRGAPLQPVERLDVVAGNPGRQPPGCEWVLQGFTSNLRYATRLEIDLLRAVQPSLGRPEALCAALIPIKKSVRWWDLPQDERRAIFEEESHHTKIGMEYLPQVARRLHHCRDIGGPFDFLTWFEYAPGHAHEFESLVARLRTTKEWEFVEREIDIRLRRTP